jgi:acylphosphatase
MVREMVKANQGKNLLVGTKFRLFKDLSVEIPYNFDDKEFDEFLQEIDKRGYFTTKHQNPVSDDTSDIPSPE